MHFCTADIALASDEQQVVSRGPRDPISWPEIDVLRTLHGDAAVRNVKPFVWVDQTAQAEQQRLLMIYGNVVTEKVFMGRRPQMEMDAAEMDVLEPGAVWVNPITREVAPVPDPEEEVDEVEEEVDTPNAKLSRLAKKRPRDDKGRLLPAVSDEPTPEL